MRARTIPTVTTIPFVRFSEMAISPMWYKIKRRIARMVHALFHHSAVPIFVAVMQRKMGRMISSKAEQGILTVPPVSAIVGQKRPSSMAESAEGSTAKIPRIIFQTWKSCVDVPENYRIWRQTFFELNPGFEIVLWDDDDNRAFVESNFPWFLPYYNRYPKEIFRADAVRPLFLFFYGGFYADMDTECLRPLEELRTRGDVLLGKMGPDPSFEHSVPNAIMASKPRQLFWVLAIKMMMEILDSIPGPVELKSFRPEKLTGPVFLKTVVDRYVASDPAEVMRECAAVLELLGAELRNNVRPGSITLLDPDEWYPVDWTNPVHRLLRKDILDNKQLLAPATARRLFDRASMVTYWSHSW